MPIFANPHLNEYYAAGERFGTVLRHCWYVPGIGTCWAIQTTTGEEIHVIEKTWELSVITPPSAPLSVPKPTQPKMPSLFGARSQP
ncbi:hypothetical protein [Deinococcus marmoris]|uniref:hypothetical protein n=1 Tax=Deinococcus marmoris TaxID=249408 RepID=UPI00158A04A4|nr:hypothetical protein [Deinococcus marmoris]